MDWRRPGDKPLSETTVVNLLSHICVTRLQWACASIMKWLLHIIFCLHDDVIKWETFPRYWPFVGGIHLWLMDCPHKSQLCGALMFSLICAWTNVWANNRDAGGLRRHRAHYDVTVMNQEIITTSCIHTEPKLCHLVVACLLIGKSHCLRMYKIETRFNCYF